MPSASPSGPPHHGVGVRVTVRVWPQTQQRPCPRSIRSVISSSAFCTSRRSTASSAARQPSQNGRPFVRRSTSPRAFTRSICCEPKRRSLLAVRDPIEDSLASVLTAEALRPLEQTRPPRRWRRWVLPRGAPGGPAPARRRASAPRSCSARACVAARCRTRVATSRVVLKGPSGPPTSGLAPMLRRSHVGSR